MTDVLLIIGAIGAGYVLMACARRAIGFVRGLRPYGVASFTSQEQFVGESYWTANNAAKEFARRVVNGAHRDIELVASPLFGKVEAIKWPLLPGSETRLEMKVFDCVQDARAGDMIKKRNNSIEQEFGEFALDFFPKVLVAFVVMFGFALIVALIAAMMIN